jgi:hypothetical protein
MASNLDPVWVTFPRWIEESGLPAHLVETCGAGGWLVFRKLVEIDCEENLTPQWFSFSLPRTATWVGLPVERLLNSLAQLEEGGWIQRLDREMTVQQARIHVPLQVPVAESQIRQNLEATCNAKGGRFLLRYADDVSGLDRVERVLYLYQMLFGPRFSPKVVQDLEEIANTYDQALIYESFAEAFDRKIKTFSWIKSHLQSSVTAG